MRPIRTGPSEWGVLRRLFWRAAWHPLETVGGVWLFGFALGNGLMIPGSFLLGRDGLGTAALFSVAGALAGTFIWGSSVAYVNRETAELKAEFERTARTLLDIDEDRTVTVSEAGSQFGLTPADTYRLSSTRTDGDHIVLERAEFETESYSLVGHSPRRLARDQFEDIDTERETLSIRIDNTPWAVEHPFSRISNSATRDGQ
ncbi:hypothetical protein [Halolamina sp. C58]|uniref:hypothetical protein n=1 Tax=Halolamina sp. C58 TaxID=3421640 RepID=UPI003EBA4C1B